LGALLGMCGGHYKEKTTKNKNKSQRYIKISLKISQQKI
jgi:hypothetical protein